MALKTKTQVVSLLQIGRKKTVDEKECAPMPSFLLFLLLHEITIHLPIS